MAGHPRESFYQKKKKKPKKKELNRRLLAKEASRNVPGLNPDRKGNQTWDAKGQLVKKAPLGGKEKP